MKKFLAIAAAASLVALAHTPAQAGAVSPLAAKSAAPATSSDAGLVHNVRGRGRGFATGLVIGLGVVGAIAASRAHAHRYHEERHERWEHERRCRRWYHSCNAGSDRACWRFETRC